VTGLRRVLLAALVLAVAAALLRRRRRDPWVRLSDVGRAP
jgi:hypothetical protein